MKQIKEDVKAKLTVPSKGSSGEKGPELMSKVCSMSCQLS